MSTYQVVEGIYSFRLFVGDDGEVYYYIGT